MGPSVPEILSGEFSPKWGPSVSEIFNSDFFRGDFLTEMRVRTFVPGAICARDFNRSDFYTQ